MYCWCLRYQSGIFCFRLDGLHAQLISNLACDFLDPSIDGGRPAKKFRLNARRFLITAAERSKTSPEDVLDALEHNGCIGPGKYQELIPLVENIDENIVQMISGIEKEMEQIDNEGEKYIFVYIL